MTDNYWSNRYVTESTPWDMGSASPPLTAFLQGLYKKDYKILIPGAGNAYEAEWLQHNGFTNVWVIDIAQEPLDNLSSRCPDFPKDHLICADFFDLKDQFDIIIEQTFFCALHPSERENYVSQMKKLLKNKR